MRADWRTIWTDLPASGWLAAIVCALMFAAPMAGAAQTGGVGLVGVRFGGDAAGTRVVLDLDAAVTGRSLADESAPQSLVFALPKLLSADPLRGDGRGLVKAWSVVDQASGARLVLEVRPGATATHRFLIPPPTPGGLWRYVIDIVPGAPSGGAVASLGDTVRRPAAAVVASAGIASLVSSPAIPRGTAPTPNPAPGALDGAAARLTSLPLGPAGMPSRIAATFHQPTATPPAADSPWGPGPSSPQSGPPPFGAGPAAAGATPSLAPTPPIARGRAPVSRPVIAGRPVLVRPIAARGPKVIVVDAGHGGHDPGARSLVRNEKDITLAAALGLKARLERMGRYKVVLTRDSDVFIPLEQRVQIARRAGADLFISLHADSAGSDPTPHGASIYTLSDSGQNRVNYVLGPHEWFGRVGGHGPDSGVRQILLDLTQRSTRNRSSEFAAVLLDHISDRVDLLPRSHRDAGYFVLLAPDVPAVLLEMGFITNPGDEMRLTDPVQRDHLIAGVADAIDAYFNGETRLAAG